MAAVFWEDLLKPTFGHKSYETTTRINKLLVLIIGIISTSLAFACELLGGLVNVREMKYCINCKLFIHNRH
jgi:Na+/proline symporter